MTCFVLIHGGGSTGATFGPLVPALRARGCGVVAVDLPIERADGDLSACADVAADAARAIDDDVVVVGHSFGGLTAPLVCARIEVRLLVLLGAMIPRPGETANEWWGASGWSAATADLDMSDEATTFYNGVPDDIAAQSATTSRDQTDASSVEPWPLDAWPDVTTRVLAFADDRFFPLAFQQRHARERLGMEAEPVPGGHMGFLSHADDLADRLVALARTEPQAASPTL